MNAVVSRTLTPEYWTRQCDLFFPAEGEYTHGLNLGRDESAFNEYTRAWFPLETENIIHINGEYDPWAAASVASDFRPGGPLQSTADTPSLVIKGGYHCSDLLTSEYNASPEVKVVVDEAVSIVKKWVEEFYGPFGRNLTQAQSATVRFAKPRKGSNIHFHTD